MTAAPDTGMPQNGADRWSATRIGELVRMHRRRRGMKVSQLARAVGVTPSLVSQIERGNSRPSVATLFALAEALDVSVDVFAGREPASSGGTEEQRPASEPGGPTIGAHDYVVRRGERRSISIAGGVSWELLTPTQRRDLEFLELVYAPHAESNESLYRHPGFEMVLVLEGRFEIHVGFDVYVLDAGDSIAFPSSLPHRYINPTEREARAVTAILRDVGDVGRSESPQPQP